MTDLTGTFLTVRGEARQKVAPDYATLGGELTSSADTRPDAVHAVASRLDQLTADLAGLGGVALRVETERLPLTWSAHSATTYEEPRRDKRTTASTRSRQIIASVEMLITVRVFDLLDALGALLARHDGLDVGYVSWHVDWDNPAWPEVRAAALQAAIRKGRDYAAALGGSLQRVEHIADAGLLGGGQQVHYGAAPARLMNASGSGGEEPGSPSLDPVPRELTAAIDARFIATGVSLAGL